MGTPDFAVPALTMLVNEGYEVVCVVTQPDRKKGRGKAVTITPIKEIAIKNNIEVFQPEKIKKQEALETIRSYKPDLFITAAYGQILSKELLDIPKYGCINVHASLLPEYRGAAPIHWSVINGEKKTGITTMLTDVGLDTGDILIKKETKIGQDTTVGELHDELAQLGAITLKETLEELTKGTLKSIPQDDSKATYAKTFKKDIGKIDFNKTSQEIHDLVRGTCPWPGAYTEYQGSRMKVWKTKIEDNACSKEKPGTIIEVSKEGMLVVTSSGAIRIIDVQFASCRVMCVGEYICGNTINVGETLGE
jgi:methionyl-tRNA formyltransferase